MQWIPKSKLFTIVSWTLHRIGDVGLAALGIDPEVVGAELAITIDFQPYPVLPHEPLDLLGLTFLNIGGQGGVDGDDQPAVLVGGAETPQPAVDLGEHGVLGGDPSQSVAGGALFAHRMQE